MKKNSLGCFSLSTLITFVLTMLVAGIFFVSNGSAMFSPGELSSIANGDVLNGVSSHAAIGSDCSACHAVPWSADTMADRCQICHIGIKVELAVDASLHGILLKYNPQPNCQDCHPDHHGSKAPITKMSPDVFPHELLGFSLASHQTNPDGFRFKCIDCHTQSITIFAQNTCRECHQEIDIEFTQTHITAYGEDCLVCHDGYETYNTDFDHEKTDFTLTGEHASASCSLCHQSARNIADLENTTKECVACHLEDDAHEQRFGTKCGVCHTPEGWVPTDYSHSKTAFPLEGRHRELECEECHKTGLAEDTPMECYACHEQDDEHNGQLGKECSTCHTSQGWTPSIFSHEQTKNDCITCHQTDDHHNGKFGTDCSVCHSTSAWQPSIFVHERTIDECITCHLEDDVHEKKFGTKCGVCHAPEKWIPTSFSHSRTAFSLEGKHRELGCEKCHITGLAEDTPTECYACHAQTDKHQGQFGKNCDTCHTPQSWKPSTFTHDQTKNQCVTCHLTDDNHNGKFGTNCSTCHGTNAWKPANFNHSQASSNCSTCHLEDDNHNGKFGTNCGTCHSTNAWKPANFNHSQASSDCSTCHLSDDNHDGKFGTNCGACHSTNAWKPANFDHVQVSSDCSTCHLEDDNHNGKFGTNCSSCHSTNTWKPSNFNHSQASSDCSTCHLSDDNHNGKFGTSCGTCHSTSTWKPANFNHSQVSDKCSTCHLQDDNHNGKFGTSCGTCHNTNAWKPANFNHSQVSSNCSTCHLQDDDHNGKFGTSCGTCHNTNTWKSANFNHAQVSSKCSNCHLADDNHNGKFGTNCSSCHSTNAWKPATFDHNLSKFPLTGAHTSVACTACHTTSTFSGLSTACVTCHAELAYHRGAFGTNCTSCHSTTAWSPAKFNLTHTFPINHGKNGSSSCAICHPSSFTSYTCYNCHEHSESEVRNEHLEEGISNFQNCMGCHPDGREHDD